MSGAIAAGLRYLFPRRRNRLIVLIVLLLVPALVFMVSFEIAKANYVASSNADGPLVFVAIGVFSINATLGAFLAAIPASIWTLRRLDRK